MITRNLGVSDGIFVAKSNVANQRVVKSAITHSNVNVNNAALVHYSSESVKANYVPFLSTRSKIVNNSNPIHFGGLRPYNDSDFGAPGDGDDGYMPPKYYTAMDDIPKDKKFNHPFYDSTIDDLNIVMGPDKSAMLVREHGVMPELLTHRFDENMKKGKYKKIGLDPENTKVYLVDAAKVANGGAMPATALNSIIASERSVKKKIVFIDNFEDLLMTLTRAASDPKEYFQNLSNKNVQVVGLIDKDYIHPPEGIESPIRKSTYEPLEQVEMNGLGVGDTKKLLKTDKRFKRHILDRYKDKNIEISDEAIDNLVTTASVKDSAPFPGKALKVLDYIASSKVKDSKINEGNSDKQHKLIITAPDVKKFFSDHSNLVTSADKDTRFKLAENVNTRFSDVGGLQEVKENLNDSILAYIKNPKTFLASGQQPPKGKLLVGEPGTGKTLIARALAGEAHVPFISASGSEFVEKYVGEGAKRVRELFTQARKAASAAENKTAIVFIDEIDAFGKKRSGDSGGEDESEKTLNQLLTEMDGFDNKDSKTRVIVLAATNRADVLDPALKRPGRFDDVLEVPAPSRNKDARLEILKIHSKNKPFASEAEKAKILDNAAKLTSGMSGAEIAEVMNKASKVVAKRADNKVITGNDVVEGFLQVVAGPIKKSDMTEQDKAMVVRHEAGHAVVIDTLKNDKISFITLDERGDFLGAVFHEPSKNMPNFKSVISSIATSYAGGLAEPGYSKYGHSAGVSGDLENVTNMVDKAVTKWGLGRYTPQLSIDEKTPIGNAYSKERKQDNKLFTETGLKIAKKINKFHDGFLDSYMDRYRANAGKGGNNLTGDGFSAMREKWIKDNGKEKEYAKLQKNANHLMDLAYNSNRSFLDKVMYKAAMNSDRFGKLSLLAASVVTVVAGTALVVKNSLSKKHSSVA